MKETRRHLLEKVPIFAVMAMGAGTVTASEDEYPSWDPTEVYRSGDRITYDGTIWEAQWWTRGDEPRESASVWSAVSAPEASEPYPPWDPEQIYRNGNRVIHDGRAWEAQWWTQGDEPSVEGRRQPWQYLHSVEDPDDGNDPVEDEEPADESDPSPPAAPTDLTVTDVGTTTLSLEWNHDCPDDITTYRLYRSESDDPSVDDDPLGEPTDESYTDEKLTPGTTYSYIVTAVDDDGVESSPASSVTETTDEDAPDREPMTDRIVAYYTSWSRYAREYLPADVPLDRLTHLTYAFMDVESDGSVIYGDESADPQNLRAFQKRRTDHPETKMLLSVGGWSLSQNFSDAAVSQQNRERFAETALELLREYDFDGIDIDWEYPDGGGADGNTERPEDPENFVLLLEAVRNRLDEAEREDGKRYELTIAGAADYHKATALDVPAIAEIVDFASIMNYDYAGFWSPETNHNSKLYSPAADPSPARFNADASMQGWESEGMPPEKLVFGLAFFGWGFEGVPNRNDGLYQSFTGPADVGWSEAGATDYEYVSKLLESGSYERHWDEEAKVPWAYSEAENVFISYEDPDSIAIKTDYVQDNGYGGLMAWELYGDRNTTLLEEIEQTLSKS